jgi:hypothetical protein
MKCSITLLLLSLSAGLASAQTLTAHDPEGVRVAENGPRLTAPVTFRLAGNASFDVGGLRQDPSEELKDRNPYPRLVRLASGNVVITDYDRVVFFDRAGKLIKSFGRRGEGPGEFNPAASVCATRGDTVLVGQGRKRMTRLTADGEFIDTFLLPEGTSTEGDFCFDDGTFVAMARVPVPQVSGSVYRFGRVRPTGQVNTIVDHHYPPFDMLVRKENPKAARGSRLYFANSDAFEIQAYDRSGKLVQIIRTSDRLVPMSDADKEKMPLMAFRGGASPAEIEADRRRAIARSPTKFWPTTGQMFIDMSGRVWVQDWQMTDQSTKPVGWTAFDSTGHLLGRLIVPPTKTKEARRFVVHFGKDEVFFKWQDDDGAAHYTAYPILPSREKAR